MLLVIALMAFLTDRFETTLDSLRGPWFLIAVLAACGSLLFVVYYFLLRTAGSYLYARFSLNMKIRFSQAAQFNLAFAPLLALDRKWLPMTEVINLEENLRYETALHILQQWKTLKQGQRAKSRNDFRNAPVPLQAAMIFLGILFAGCVITGLLNLPPASYVSRLIGDGRSYYPMLNICILCLPLLPCFVLVERKMKQSKRNNQGTDTDYYQEG